MSEFGPSPIEENKREQQGITLAQEIASLRNRASSDADYEAILQKTHTLKEIFGIAPAERRLSGELTDQMKEAKEILGDDFIGPEEVNFALKMELDSSSLPNIPFSREDLEKAKELGQMLIYRTNKAADGTPLTMKKIGNILGDKVKDEGKVFYDTDWYKDEKFFTEDAVEEGWALVTKELIADSTDKNYLEQMDALIGHLNDSFGGAEKLPEEYVEAVREYAFAKDEIAGLIDSDWEKAAEKLEGLKINQLLRQSPSEVIYDMMVYFQNRDERILDNAYTWTKRRSSGGRLVAVGAFDAGGVRVFGFRPGDRYSGLGVSFSRSR